MIDSKTFLVAQRELVENVRTKAFWIGIFIFPLILVLSIVIPSWLERSKSAREYVVVDQSGWLLDAVDQRAALPDLEKVFRHAFTLKQGGDPAYDVLPDALKTTTEQLEMALGMLEGQFEDQDPEELQNRVIEGFAATITGLSGPRGEALRDMVPGEAMDQLFALRDAVRDWWQALPAEEADAFGGSVTKGRYVRVDGPDLDGEALTAELNRRVEAEELFAYFVLGPDPVQGSDGMRYVSANLTDDDLRRWFGNHASSAVREKRLADKEIDPDVAQWIQAPLDFEVQKPGAEGEAEEVADQDVLRQWAPPAFVYLLWIAIFSVAQMLLTNTIEEKSNRIMEVLLSSVSPLQLMTGKILGIAMTGLTMVLSWVGFFFLVVSYLPALLDLDLEVDLSAIASDPFFLVSFVVYFVLGYLFYAGLLVAIGSVCNSLKEAQNLQTPVVVLLMVPLFSMIPIAQDPNGMLAKVLSFVPPFTPFVMMNRAAGPPELWEYAATTGLLGVSVALVLIAAAKIFRIGILMTGKPPKPMEILRWIRAPVGAVPERDE
ncbi:MAG: ABC transporter permease [Acidobacteriota bacterium]